MALGKKFTAIYIFIFYKKNHYLPKMMKQLFFFLYIYDM